MRIMTPNIVRALSVRSCFLPMLGIAQQPVEHTYTHIQSGELRVSKIAKHEKSQQRHHLKAFPNYIIMEFNEFE